ncbi:hypothetical protein TNCV_1225171 [Trichonephila clavipes]|nr:hypothetical protein TNCV_1225171 [Trichonephila clavipes]
MIQNSISVSGTAVLYEGRSESGSNDSVRGVTFEKSAEEDRLAIDCRARGYSLTNHEDRRVLTIRLPIKVGVVI